MNKLLQGVVAQWLLRRGMEIGGLVGTLVFIYQALPPNAQHAINQIASGDWRNVSLGAVATIALAVWGYVWSFRATTKTSATAVVDGVKQQVPANNPVAKNIVQEAAEDAARVQPKRTLRDKLGLGK